MEVDPDYAFEAVEEHQPKTKIGSRFLEQSGCEQAKEKIRKIIKEQFSQEILRKEEEAALITDRLVETRQLLDRLRACIVASYYASSFTKPLEKNKGSVPGTAQHPAIQNILRKAVTSVLSKNSPVDNIKDQKESVNELHQASVVDEALTEESLPCPNDAATGAETKINDTKTFTSDAQIQDATPKKSTTSLPANNNQSNIGARHRIKKTVIVGNVSKYIPPDKREGNDKSTHKWMVYVRGSKDEPRIDHFVRKVWFFLHPSYRPNDLVEVTEAPFHLTRRGWGEFPIRCQLHFCDPRNRRVDIIHNLRLDRTYTGLQTLGAETVCNVELDQSTIDLRIDRFLNQPVSDKELENKQNKADADVNEKEFDGSVSQAEPMETEENDAENANDASPSLDGKPQGSLPESPTEGEKTDTQGALVSEKKTRRRRGDSCALADQEDTNGIHEAKKCLIEDLSDQELEDVSLSANEVIEETETSKSDTPQPSPKEVKVELGAPLDAANTEASESQSPHATQAASQNTPPTTNTTNNSSSSNSGVVTPTGTPAKSLSLPGTPVRSKTCVILTASPKPLTSKGATTGATADAGRPRSVSADSGSVIAQSADSSGKLVVLQRGGGGSKQQVVVLRGRSQSSAGEAAKLGAQVGQNYTVLKRISIPGAGQSSAVQLSSASPRKRQLQLSPGSVVLSVVPEKQIKLSLPEKRRSSSDPLSQKIVSTTLLNSSGVSSNSTSSIVPTAGRPLLGPNHPHTAQPKSFIVKNTKQGLVLVTDKHQSAKPYQLPAATVKTKTEGKVVKGLSQQQLVSLKALQTALLGAGVSINKPVQVKLEKTQGGTQQAKPLQKTPQFVLTTVTDGQGKQQLALVSADHLKQKSDGSCKDSVLKHVGKQDQLSPINIQTKPKENLPFYKMVACAIMKNKVVDLTEDAMPLAGILVPLVQQGRQVQQLPFAAESESEFLEWNVGKQRAAEWQRASLVQRILAFIKQTKKLDQNVPSKRSIVNWFLKRGYSVFTDGKKGPMRPFRSQNNKHWCYWQKNKKSQCDLFVARITNTGATEYEVGAGSESRASECSEATTATTGEVKPLNLAPTLTAHTGLLQQLADAGLREATNNDEGEVDVVGYSPPKFVKQEFVQESDAFDAKDCPEFRTPEILAAEMAAKEVGVKFPSVPITTEVSAPMCQVVLAKALKSFCQEMLRESLACAIERRDGANKLQRILPAEITVEDVIGSVIQCDKLSLVSDKFIGI